MARQIEVELLRKATVFENDEIADELGCDNDDDPITEQKLSAAESKVKQLAERAKKLEGRLAQGEAGPPCNDDDPITEETLSAAESKVKQLAERANKLEKRLAQCEAGPKTPAAATGLQLDQKLEQAERKRVELKESATKLDRKLQSIDGTIRNALATRKAVRAGDRVEVIASFEGNSKAMMQQTLKAGCIGVVRKLDSAGDALIDFFSNGNSGDTFSQWVLQSKFELIDIQVEGQTTAGGGPVDPKDYVPCRVHEALKSQNGKLQQEHQSLKAEYDQLQREMVNQEENGPLQQTLEKTTSQALAAHSTVLKENIALKQQLENQAKDYRATIDNCDQLRNAVALLEEDKSTLQQKLNEQAGQEPQLGAQTARRISELTAAKQQSDQEIQRLQADSLRATAQLKDAQQALRLQKDTLDTTVAENNDLKNQVQRMQGAQVQRLTSGGDGFVIVPDSRPPSSQDSSPSKISRPPSNAAVSPGNRSTPSPARGTGTKSSIPSATSRTVRPQLGQARLQGAAAGAPLSQQVGAVVAGGPAYAKPTQAATSRVPALGSQVNRSKYAEKKDLFK